MTRVRAQAHARAHTGVSPGEYTCSLTMPPLRVGAVSRTVEWPEYQPKFFEAPNLAKKERPLNDSPETAKDKWADPGKEHLSNGPTCANKFETFRMELRNRPTYVDRPVYEYDGGAPSKPLHEAGLIGEDGLPINPRGRTGMEGRGQLGKWGANHMAEPIITRFSKDGRLQFIAEKRKDNGQVQSGHCSV